MKKIIIIVALLFAVCAYAVKAPQYRSSRIHGTGNAFVAVADNADALYYNPAGLNLINRLGDFEKNPDLGYMPKNGSSFRLLSITAELPINEINNFLNLCGNRAEFWKAVRGVNINKFGKIDWCEELMDELKSDLRDSLDVAGNKIAKFDGKPLLGSRIQLKALEFAMHNFGFSIWANTSSITPYIDLGAFIPFAGYDTVLVDIAFQTAFAFSPVDKWSVGVGLKGVQRNLKHGTRIFMSLNEEAPFKPDGYQDSLKTLVDSLETLTDLVDPMNLIRFNKYNMALDFGALYQIHREVRLGVSLRDIYFSDLAGQSVTPNLSLGAMASPMILQSNSWWERKVNIAVDYVNILDGTVGDMFLGHLNFGAEITQTVIPSPTKEMSFWPQTLFGALGGLAGAGIGYLIAGGSIESVDVGPFTLGSVISMGLGALIGGSFGGGTDLLKVSAGGGFEGGYPSATLAVKLPSIFGLRYSTYAEELGTRTGQKGNRYHTIEFGGVF